MNIMLKGTLVTLGLITVLWTGFWLLPGPAAEDHWERPVATGEKPRSDEDIKILQRELATLRNRLAQIENEQRGLPTLRNRLAQLEEAQHSRAQDVGSAIRLQAELVADAKPKDRPKNEEKTGRSGKWPEQSAEERRGKVIDYYEASFWQEPANPEWTSEVQDRVIQALDNTAIEGSSLLAVDCQSTLCRVEVSHDSGEAHSWFLGNMLVALPDDTESFFYQLADRTVLYLARAGHRLPSPLQ